MDGRGGERMTSDLAVMYTVIPEVWEVPEHADRARALARGHLEDLAAERDFIVADTREVVRPVWRTGDQWLGEEHAILRRFDRAKPDGYEVVLHAVEGIRV